MTHGGHVPSAPSPLRSRLGGIGACRTRSSCRGEWRRGDEEHHRSSSRAARAITPIRPPALALPISLAGPHQPHPREPRSCRRRRWVRRGCRCLGRRQRVDSAASAPRHMTSQGTAHGRFTRAIERRNFFQVELALREMGGTSGDEERDASTVREHGPRQRNLAGHKCHACQRPFIRHGAGQTACGC